MTHSVVRNEKGTLLTINFGDEGVELTQSILVDGDEAKALQYLPFFEKDCRRNFAYLFPQPVQPEPEGGILG